MKIPYEIVCTFYGTTLYFFERKKGSFLGLMKLLLIFRQLCIVKYELVLFCVNCCYY